MTVNEDGSIKVTIPAGAEPGTDITVPVVVTYPDESTDTVEVIVSVEKIEGPTPPAKDNDSYEPDYKGGEGKPGNKVTVPAPGFKDKDGNPTTAPNGTTFAPGGKVAGGVSVDKDGSITVTIPEGAKPGSKITVPVEVTYPDGTKDTVEVTVTVQKPGVDTGKCVATSLGFGLPLIALLPIGLATQIDLPGVTPIVNEVSARLDLANSQIQQQMGIFNPQLAGQMADINNHLKGIGADLSMVAAGIALIAAGILAGTLIYDNCSPDGGFTSSVKDLEVKGSSGNTHKLSSNKQDKKQ